MSDLPENLKYTNTHQWAKLEADGIVRVGITNFAQNQLGDLVFIQFPGLGQRVGAHESCAVVESVKTASDVPSPVSGEIAAVNDALVDEPEQVNDHPYDAWLFCVKADNLDELDDLLDSAAYQQLI